jgi:hypothetical protein
VKPAVLVVFARDEDRAAVLAALPGADVRRDKPAGGKLAFVRRLRAEKFDLAVVAWQGGERIQPMKIAALLIGARRTIVVDRRGRRSEVRWLLPWTWFGPALRAGLATDPVLVVAAVCACYRATVGLLVGALRLFASEVVLRMRRPRS